MKKIGGIALIVIFIDQMIKYLFLNQMEIGESAVLISHFFSFTLVKNTGVAFSLLSDYPFLIIIISITIMIGMYFMLIKNHKLQLLHSISYGLLYGGIIGNLLDRFFQKGVVDYLDFQFFGYDFPIFNLADICVVCGAICMLILIAKEDESCKSIS